MERPSGMRVTIKNPTTISKAGIEILAETCLPKGEGYMREYLDDLHSGALPGRIIVATEGLHFLGWAFAAKFQEHMDHYGFMVYVKPEARKMGVGKALVEAAKTLGKIRVWASTKSAYRFYDNLGLIPD